jgi:catechol 2,3-dioxygenase-like lactoylglutathione lyase family enzyme
MNDTNLQGAHPGGATVRRMDNVAIVVDDLAAAKGFFAALGLELEGEATVEGSEVDRLLGLEGVRTDIAMMRTPDGHGRIELTEYLSPPVEGGDVSAPANTLGAHRVMFAVDDIDATIDRLRPHGGELLGDLVQYESSYRLCYVRGPGGILVALAQETN